MKFLLRILFSPFTLLARIISPLGKPVNLAISNSYYYNKPKTDLFYSSAGNWFELGKTLLNADVLSFVPLNQDIGKDKGNAYYQGYRITHPDIDVESFRASAASWMWHIGMDKNHVYVFDRTIIDGEWHATCKLVEGADPVTFVQYDVYWSKDALCHFYDHKAIDVDYGSFELINETFARDNGHIYLHYHGQFQLLEGNVAQFKNIDQYHAQDASYIYFFLDYLDGNKIEKLQKIPFKDPDSIKVLEGNYLLVDEEVYYRGCLLKGAHASEITILSQSYAKDHNKVYYENEPLEGADAMSFRYDEANYCYCDKHHKYMGADIWVDEGDNATES